MNCVIDKADNLVVKDCDTHFCEFVGVHISKIHQGKLQLHKVLMPQDREYVMSHICKKGSDYLYFDFNIKNKDDELVHVYCTGKNIEGTTLCSLTLADISRSVEKSNEIRAKAKEMNHLIDLVAGGVTLFKVDKNMNFEALYMNEACCKFFGTTKEKYRKIRASLTDLFHPDDKSIAYQAIGNAMATKKPIDIEIRIKTHQDEYIWCKMDSAIQRYDNDGCPIFHAVFTDISNIKKSN